LYSLDYYRLWIIYSICIDNVNHFFISLSNHKSQSHFYFYFYCKYLKSCTYLDFWTIDSVVYTDNACLLNYLIYGFCFRIQYLIEQHLFVHGFEEDFAHQKKTAEYICTELLEADEANLLPEEGCLNCFCFVNQPFRRTICGFLDR